MASKALIGRWPPAAFTASDGVVWLAHGGVLLALDLGAHLGRLLDRRRAERAGRAVAVALRPDHGKGDHGQAISARRGMKKRSGMACL
jgi:hypothetical protein